MSGDDHDADAFARSLRDLPPPMPSGIGDELAAELARMTAVSPRRPVRDAARIAVVSIVYGAALLVLFRMRRDMEGLSLTWIVGVAATWLAGFVSLLWLALVPRRGAVMPRWRAAGVGAAVASVVFVIAGFVLHRSAAGSVELGLDRLHHGYRCLELGAASALIPVVLGALVLRGAIPVGSRWVSAALGAAGGSLGGLVLHLHCPISDGWHVGVVHGGLVLVSALLAAALTPRP